MSLRDDLNSKRALRVCSAQQFLLFQNLIQGFSQDAAQDAEGLQTMRILGKNMAYLLKCKEAARVAGIEPPEPETVAFTNFIR